MIPRIRLLTSTVSALDKTSVSRNKLFKVSSKLFPLCCARSRNGLTQEENELLLNCALISVPKVAVSFAPASVTLLFTP